MRAKLPHLVIGLSSLAGVVAVAVVDLGRSSPGRITAVHSRVQELEGGRDCSSCHGNWLESMGDACLECHEPIAQHLELNAGLHGRLAEVEADRCFTCHSEHHGESFAIVNLQSFMKAGIADPAQFDHNMVGFEMTGKHLELACTECHEFAEAQLVPEGEHRYIGLRQDCASCHEGPHEGSMRQACNNCHSQDGFETQHYERHAQFFPLLGAHAEANCVTCHEPESTHSLAAQMAGTTPDGERECSACHEDPHAAAFVLGNARVEGLPRDAVCANCHDPIATFAQEHASLSPLQHLQSGFALDSPHADAQCFDCHGPEGASFAERHPGRLADDCASCHESPHGDQFVNDGFSDNKCITCHERQHFTPHAFSLEMHAEAAIELTGKHTELECAACHEVEGPEEVRMFRGTPERCESCHGDAHQGFFDGFNDQLALANGGTCAACHGTTHFAELPASGFQHERWTGFEIHGAHAQNACESCHQPSAEPDELGRRFGRVSAHFGVVDGCASCHQDPHAGEFDKPHLPAEVEGRAECTRCHGSDSFRALPFGFDHGKWTEFELDSQHEDLACSSCHAPLRGNALRAAGGRTWKRAADSSCADCHADPHARQFDVAGTTDCARCHLGTRPFAEIVFRHNLDSSFALDDTHASLACAACHKPTQVGGETVTRFRPLGQECADCHGVNEDVLRKRGGTKR